MALTSSYDFVLTGRLSEENGKPVDGPVALSVRFYHAASGGNPVLTVTEGLEKVELQEGVFHIRLSLDAADYHTVFSSVTQATYFEITDLTNARNSPYERSQVSMLPYAAKIPINDDIFSYNSEGLLSLSSAPQSGKYLKGNADGSIGWDSPGSASASETYTNKSIDADDNNLTDISNANIKAAAGIVDSKLATISTAGKVSGAAITSGTIGGSTAVATSGDITTTGAVGVGTATPGSKLEVKGSGTTSATAGLNVTSSAGASRFYVRDDGYVGIGTTSPSAHLDVRGTGNTLLYLTNSGADYSTSVSAPYVMIGPSTSSSYYGLKFNSNADSASNATGFLFDARLGTSTGNLFDIQKAGASKMVIDSGGKLGLGTGSPSTLFHTTGQIRTDYGGTSYYEGARIWTSSSSWHIYSDASEWHMKVFNSNLSATKYTAGASANHGIVFTLDSDNNDTTSGFYVGRHTAVSTFAPATHALMAVLEDGNVGIGIHNPTYKLQVNGEPAANGYTAFTSYSDRRLKSNIEPIQDGILEKILQLKPSSFFYNKLTNYDAKTRKRRNYGFIAQDLKEVFPDMAHETEISGSKYFDTNLSALQIYLVKAIQELKVWADDAFNFQVDEMARLKEKLVEKEMRIEQLEKHAVSVTAYLCEKDPKAPFCVN